MPNKTTEVEYWTKFFQSDYYHRERLISGTKDICTECTKFFDLTPKNAVGDNAGDPLLDIRQFQESSLCEGFRSATSNKGDVNSGNIVPHSMMVLKTCIDVKSLSTVTPTARLDKNPPEKGTINGTNNNKITNGVHEKHPLPESSEMEPKRKQLRIMEKYHFDDLEGPEAQ